MRKKGMYLLNKEFAQMYSIKEQAKYPNFKYFKNNQPNTKATFFKRKDCILTFKKY